MGTNISIVKKEDKQVETIKVVDKAFKVKSLQDRKVKHGGNLSAEILSTKENITVQWEVNRNGRWVKLATGKVLSLPVQRSFNGAKLRGIVSDGTSTISTNVVTVYVEAKPKLASKAYAPAMYKAPAPKAKAKSSAVEEEQKTYIGDESFKEEASRTFEEAGEQVEQTNNPTESKTDKKPKGEVTEKKKKKQKVS